MINFSVKGILTWQTVIKIGNDRIELSVRRSLCLYDAGYHLGIAIGPLPGVIRRPML